MITREHFIERVGREPVNDDLERCNCDCGNVVGHYMCGWCESHDGPRFICGCHPNKIVLTSPGFFKSVYEPSFFEAHVFVVEQSEFPVLIPNFGLLPLVFNNAISLLFEDGTPDKLKVYVLRKTTQDDRSPPLIMEDGTYQRMVTDVHTVLTKLVTEGRLFKVNDRWTFLEPGE